MVWSVSGLCARVFKKRPAAIHGGRRPRGESGSAGRCVSKKERERPSFSTTSALSLLHALLSFAPCLARAHSLQTQSSVHPSPLKPLPAHGPHARDDRACLRVCLGRARPVCHHTPTAPISRYPLSPRRTNESENALPPRPPRCRARPTVSPPRTPPGRTAIPASFDLAGGGGSQ